MRFPRTIPKEKTFMHGLTENKKENEDFGLNDCFNAILEIIGANKIDNLFMAVPITQKMLDAYNNQTGNLVDALLQSEFIGHYSVFDVKKNSGVDIVEPDKFVQEFERVDELNDIFAKMPVPSMDYFGKPIFYRKRTH